MKKTMIAIATSVLLTACSNNGGNDIAIEKNPYEVYYLFEKDGVKVYRFYDEGYYRYFTNRNETIGTIRAGKHNRIETVN
jgi:hypothetical protein